MKRGMGDRGYRRGFLGRRRSRWARKSLGISAASASAKISSQVLGTLERITSPVSGSLRIWTSCEEKRKSEGRRTAWLRPFMKSLAVRGMSGDPLAGERCLDNRPWYITFECLSKVGVQWAER